MDQEHRQILAGLKKVLSDLRTIKDIMQQDGGDHLKLGEWRIYHQMINKDLNNIGQKVRALEADNSEVRVSYQDKLEQLSLEHEAQIQEIRKKYDAQIDNLRSNDHQQDLAHAKLSTKIGVILGLVGGPAGIAALIFSLL